MAEEIEFSEWQEGPPPHDGVWQILANDWTHYAKYQNGYWGAGGGKAADAKEAKFAIYDPNNNPSNPIKWRGRLVNSSQDKVGHSHIKKEKKK